MLDKVNSVMLNNNTSAEIIFTLIQEQSKEKAKQFAMNVYRIWKSLNLKVGQNVSETCQTITVCAN